MVSVELPGWRHALRRATQEDFPASWRTGETAVRSHESGYDVRKYQVRLEEASTRKLEELRQTFHRSAAEVIRQLVAQARPRDFPHSWHLAVNERLGPPVHGPGTDEARHSSGPHP
jgi:hypothetical protein